MPETSLRRAVWALDLRYRLQYKICKTRPDMMFVGARLAVFVDGCLWHGYPQHSTMPRNNRYFWDKKLIRNREQEADNKQSLVAQGWRVLRLWEREIEASPATCAWQTSSMLGQTKGSMA